MPNETQVKVTGKGENIHIQRDPMRGRRGYYTKGWSRASDINWLKPRKYNPTTDCRACKGKSTVPDEKVNAHRSHYKRFIMCPDCKGTGSKEDGR